MSHWNPELLLMALALLVILVVVLPRLGPSEKPPLDTKHDPHDLPEWYPFSSDRNDKR